MTAHLTDPTPLISAEQAEADRQAFLASARQWEIKSEQQPSPRAKLTFGDVCDIRDRVFNGHEKQNELAAEYGISTGQLSKIVSGKTW